MTPLMVELTEEQRLDQRRFIEIASTGKGQPRPTTAVPPSTNERGSPRVHEPRVILTAHKRTKAFESAVSISSLRDAVSQMERDGWTVMVDEEHAAPARGGRQ